MCVTHLHRPLSRRLDRCDRVIQNESRDPFGGNVYYVTMQITFLTRKFRNWECNLHCDVVHITTKWVSSLALDCNGVFAIKAYGGYCDGVFLYLLVIANFVYMWEVYCFDVCGTFLASVILICSCIFNILRFLSKGSVCALYVLIDIILIAFL